MREKNNFIPKPYKKEAITVRLTSKQLEMLNHSAEVYKLSRSALISQCIDFALEHMPLAQED